MRARTPQPRADKVRQRLFRLLPNLARVALFGLILFASSLGAFSGADSVLRDLRFAQQPREVTGKTVYLDIDSQSLQSVGVWPWPRHVHGEILDRLMALGANRVVFDVDFSVPSSPSEDAAFAGSLEKAGGYAYLAAFRQQARGGVASYNVPIPLFGRWADPVSVNVSLDSNGVVRTYPFAMTIGGRVVPSLASTLSGIDAPADSGFSIDYSINPGDIARISVADLLARKVDAAAVAGKDVVIGASAVELRDFFVVPRYGILPGALLQALATETLEQGRALQPFDTRPAMVLVFALGLLAVLGRRRITVPAAILLAALISLIAEVVALVLQTGPGLLLDTAAVHFAAAAFALSIVAGELVRRGQQRLTATRERDAVRRMLDQVVTDNFDGVVIVDGAGRIVAASQSASETVGCDLAGRRAREALPTEFAELTVQIGSSQGELAMQLNGSDHIFEYVITHSNVQVDDGPVEVACLTFRDVTARRQAEERLRYLGGHDVLTGALSRVRFVELVSQAIGSGQGDVGVVMIDLRRFRIINDTLGHSQGDLLLKQVVSRLKSMGPDAVGRLGGDSFAVLVPGMDTEKLRGYCETVTLWLAFPYQLGDGHRAIIAACAGAASSGTADRDGDVLLSQADMALSAAKLRTGSGVALFAPEMDDRLRERQAMDSALRNALSNGEFSLAFQPQIDIASGALIGAEALTRWAPPKLGPIAPSRFIPAAEETGLIVELGQWALRTACQEAAAWPGNLKLAINISPVQFELSDVVTDIIEALTTTGLAPHRLELEITEGTFVRDVEATTARLEELRRLGVGIALDDFGTGYSSLSYLSRLPIDKIKVDQSFVRRLPDDKQALAVIQAVVTLGSSLGKRVIAEGIENADQAWMLQAIGCTEGQGYHFGRPMTGEAFRQRIVSRPVPLAQAS